MPPKLNTETFIQKANIKHNGFYDYSLTNYTGSQDKVLIICNNHGIFSQTASSHLNWGCQKCGRKKQSISLTHTTEVFINKCIKVHGSLYDYSETIYTGCQNEVVIICRKHEKFLQRARHHLEGYGCQKCGDEKVALMAIARILTTEEIIERAIVVHGNLYNYSETVYTNSRNKMVIICMIHGIFLQLPGAHLNGRGCEMCGYIKAAISNTFTRTQFINLANKIHNFQYNYTQVIYISSRDDVTIICPKHGKFKQTADSHIGGSGCKFCGIEKRAELRKYTTEIFIERAGIVHGNFYNYSETKYVNCKDKMLIICPKHGYFLQNPSSHLQGRGCKKCSRVGYSKIALEWMSCFNEYIDIQTAEDINGEYKIELKQYSEYWKKYIKVDGYCEKYKLCFEFDGCLFHGCDECKCSLLETNPLSNIPMIYLREKTLAKHELIKSLGYNLIVIKECHYNKIKKANLITKYVEDLYFNNIFQNYINKTTSIRDIPYEDIKIFLIANNKYYKDDNDAYDKARLLLKNKRATGHTISIIEWTIAYNLVKNKTYVPNYTINEINKLSQNEINKLAKLLTMNGNNVDNIINILRYLRKLDENVNVSNNQNNPCW